MKGSKKSKTLKEKLELLDNEAKRQIEIVFGEREYYEFQEIANTLDSYNDFSEKEFTFIASELNAYLG